MNRPLCLVLMPVGRRPSSSGARVDFDAVYADLVEPAIRRAGFEPLRAEAQQAAGVVDQTLFERLMLCEYVVADMTTADPVVYYQLGLRHALRATATVMVFAEGTGAVRLDAAPWHAVPYVLGPGGRPERPEVDAGRLAARLGDAARDQRGRSIYQLVEGFPDVQRMKTDVFRERVAYSEAVKRRLAAARTQGEDAVRAVEHELTHVAEAEAGVVIDLMLSYRAVRAWEAMVAIVQRMAPPLAKTVMVQEQLGFALNRVGRDEEAEQVLLALIERAGPSSETCGILGRVYKDRWEAARRAGDTPRAVALLDQAIDAYRQGFEADWRDAYPGVNAVTLMELRDPPDPRRLQLLPIVAYAVERRLAGTPDYWDYATLVEIAVLERDETRARAAHDRASAAVREPFEPETTARNLRLIREAREARGESLPWARSIEEALACRAAQS